jgi:hypothetical protein
MLASWTRGTLQTDTVVPVPWGERHGWRPAGRAARGPPVVGRHRSLEVAHASMTVRADTDTAECTPDGSGASGPVDVGPRAHSKGPHHDQRPCRGHVTSGHARRVPLRTTARASLGRRLSPGHKGPGGGAGSGAEPGAERRQLTWGFLLLLVMWAGAEDVGLCAKSCLGHRTAPGIPTGQGPGAVGCAGPGPPVMPHGVGQSLISAAKRSATWRPMPG